MNTQKELTPTTAATSLRERLAARQPELVEVSPEEGFTYIFKKPNTLGLVLSGSLPQMAADAAAEQWAKDGIGSLGETTVEQTKEEIAKELLRLTQKVLEASHSPKLVGGIADPEKDEISVEEVPDSHLGYFLRWMKAGGSESVMLSTFPQQSPERAFPQPDVPPLRTKTKRIRRIKR